MIVKHPRMIIKQHEYFINYRYVGDVSRDCYLECLIMKVNSDDFISIISIIDSSLHKHVVMFTKINYTKNLYYSLEGY